MARKPLPLCTWCGHEEVMHHPSRTETWCIQGIAGFNPCDCPGYNPNGVLRVRAWINKQMAQAWDRGFTASGVMLMTDPPQKPKNPYRKQAEPPADRKACGECGSDEPAVHSLDCSRRGGSQMREAMKMVAPAAPAMVEVTDELVDRATDTFKREYARLGLNPQSIDDQLRMSIEAVVKEALNGGD